MNELIQQLNAAGIRYLLIGGQAMRLAGMPRFSMDWDFYIPPRDGGNFDRLNKLLENELDAPLVPFGPAGENFIQTY
jgi:predicted nucleotidyltransferase component of viral defense system